MEYLQFGKDQLFYVRDEWVMLDYFNKRERYLNNVLKDRGYIYSNQIYECFNNKWDPKNENKCYLYVEKQHLPYIGQLILEVIPLEDGDYKLIVYDSNTEKLYLPDYK